MQTRFIVDEWPEPFGNHLVSIARRSRSICLSTAFLTREGADAVLLIRDRMAGPAVAQRVRVIAGVWQGFTDPVALRMLNDAKNIELRISHCEGFHAKYYLFATDESTTILSGSANLTAKGLAGAGEVMVTLEVPSRSRTAADSRDVFRRLWEKSLPPDGEFIDDYADARRSISRRPTAKESNLGKVLRALQRRQQKARDNTPEISFWLPVWEELSERVVSKVLREADWSRKHTSMAHVEPIGMTHKGKYEHIAGGRTIAWVLNMTRHVGAYRIFRSEVLDSARYATSDGCKYWYLVRRTTRERKLTDSQKIWLVQTGLVKSWRPAESHERVLSPRLMRGITEQFRLISLK